MDDPCTAALAVARAASLVNNGGEYILGTGDYPGPWTTNKYGTGSDCAGFAICYAWKLVRHRPGFNRGWWASVSDDINVNSAVEDAYHNRELFTPIHRADARPGDLVCYETERIKDHTGLEHLFIGHVALVEVVPAHYSGSSWAPLGLIQCHGPNFQKPAVVRTDGHGFDLHDAMWPTVGHCELIRPKERL